MLRRSGLKWVMCILALALATPVHATAPKKLAVVIHPRNPTTQLSTDEVVSLFTAKQQFWPGRVNLIVIFQKPDTKASAAFYERALRQTAEEVEASILKKRYAGKLAFKVETVDTADQVKARVASEVTAIGYIWADEADSNVRIVQEF